MKEIKKMFSLVESATIFFLALKRRISYYERSRIEI